MVKTEVRRFSGIRIVLTCGLKQVECAQHVRRDEIVRAIDGSIDMAFCRQMHDRVRRVLAQNTIELSPVAYIYFFKKIIWMVFDVVEVGLAGRIGHGVKIDDAVPILNGTAYD